MTENKPISLGKLQDALERARTNYATRYNAHQLAKKATIRAQVNEDSLRVQLERAKDALDKASQAVVNAARAVTNND